MVLLAYCGLAALAAWASFDTINCDGICYLTRSQHLARGELLASVSGYWSPLLIWLVAPLLWLGLPALVAARVVLALGGAGLILATDRLCARAALRGIERGLALGLMALFAARVVGDVLTPDLLLAACLVGYSSLALHPELSERPRLALATGAAAGLAYLAKAYALPFVALHFPLTLLLRRFALGEDVPLPRLRRTALLAAAGLALVALPWVVVLSVRYSRPTWGTVGPLAHAAAGPGVVPGQVQHPSRVGIWGEETDPAAEARFNARYVHWSPFASRSNALHQARILWATAKAAKSVFQELDPVGLSLSALLLAPFAFLLPRDRIDPRLRFLCLWVPLTSALFTSGYLLILVDWRYLAPYLTPLVVVLLLSAGAQVGDALAGKRSHLALRVCLVCLLAAYPAHRLQTRLRRPRDAWIEQRTRLVSALRSGPRGRVALLCEPGRTPQDQERITELAFCLGRPIVGHMVGELTPEPLASQQVESVFAISARGTPDSSFPPGWTRSYTFTVPDPEGDFVLDVFDRAGPR
ncbi:MAG: hypothetical protein AB7N76_22615 [Planctomycetota bacterium]